MTRQELAVQAAKAAGEVHAKHFNKPIQSTNKNPRDIVTTADTKDSILAEESGASNEGQDFQWVIDPLDATSNFFKGSPDFCVLIALTQNNKIIYGVTWFPITQELYVAERGRGATYNGQPIHVSKEGFVKNSYGNTQMSSNLGNRKANLSIYNHLIFQARNIHVINSCIGRLLSDVASGRAEFHFRVGITPWDYAAGILLVEEAGGKVTDETGAQFTFESYAILASNGLCHSELVDTLGDLAG